MKKESRVDMSSNNDDNVKESSSLSTDGVVETLTKVTLAGFGGALAGMAVARGGGSAAARAANMSGRRIRHLKGSNTNLPMLWALACMTFASIMEACRIASPTRQIMAALQTTNQNEAAHTIGDVTLGGIIAGAAVRGNIRPNAPPLSLATRVGAGIALGLVAGTSQCGIEYLIKRLEQGEEPLDAEKEP